MLQNILVPKEFPIAETFGLDPALFEAGATVWGYDIPAPETLKDPEMQAHAQYLRALIPEVDPYYEFRPDIMPDFLYWWGCRFSNPEVLCLHGPTGSGKTTAPEQFYARIGVPMFSLKGHGKITPGEIFGQMSLVNGETQFEPAPMTLAPQYGLPVIFNELDRNNPDVNVVLHDVFENRPFPVPGNHSKIISPLPGFCICVTTNTNMVERSSQYGTAKVQDSALLQRFCAIEVRYPTDRKIERGILTRVLQPFGDEVFSYWFDQEEEMKVKTPTGMKVGAAISRAEFIDASIEVAEKVRAQSMDSTDADGALEVGFSTRLLRRWVHHAVMHCRLPERLGKSALHHTLDKYVASLTTPSTRIALHHAVEEVFGVGFDIKG